MQVSAHATGILCHAWLQLDCHCTVVVPLLSTAVNLASISTMRLVIKSSVIR